MTVYRVEEIMVHDPDVWPVDHNAPLVKRYALIDEHGTVWLRGHPFGNLRSMTRPDRSSSDCRYLLRKSAALARKDKFKAPLDANDDPFENAFWYFEWPAVPQLIHIYGIAAVMNAYFEASGSSVVRDFNHDIWIERAIAAFDGWLIEPAKGWRDNPVPRHMPTSYDNDPRRKREWYDNIRYTAEVILERLEGGAA